MPSNPTGDNSLPGRLRRFVNRPYYVYRPTQLLRRARVALAGDRTSAEVRLPWGMELVVNPAESLGATLRRNAVYELAVSEIVYRLSDPGDLALDIGANIGYMTSVLATRVGPTGKVIACEPHPALFELLAANVERWEASSTLPSITPLRVALSDRSGEGRLLIPPAFDVNMGIAGLADDAMGPGIEVKLARLDELVSEGSRVGVAKLDVEGHEARVLAGGRRALDERRIRDIVFEEHRDYPSAASALLERAGYRIFGVEQRLRHLLITEPGDARPPDDGSPPNFVATCQPDRLVKRLAPGGWRTLRPRRRGEHR